MPVNMFVGGQDPLLGGTANLEAQLRLAEQRLAALQGMNKTSNTPLWDSIDKEIEPLSEEQKRKLQENEEYMNLYNQLNSLVQSSLVNLVKHTIESSDEGRYILESQLKLIKSLKAKIIEDSNKEMDLFRRFKEYSLTHGNVTYDEFLKTL